MISIIGRNKEGSVYGQFRVDDIMMIEIEDADSDYDSKTNSDTTTGWSVRVTTRSPSLDWHVIWYTNDQDEAETVAYVLAQILIYRSQESDGRRYVIANQIDDWRKSREKRKEAEKETKSEAKPVRQDDEGETTSPS